LRYRSLVHQFELYGQLCRAAADDAKKPWASDRNRHGRICPGCLTGFAARQHARAREGAWRFPDCRNYLQGIQAQFFAPGVLAAERTAGRAFCSGKLFQLGKQLPRVLPNPVVALGHQAVAITRKRDRRFPPIGPAARAKNRRRESALLQLLVAGKCGARFSCSGPGGQSAAQPIKKRFPGPNPLL